MGTNPPGPLSLVRVLPVASETVIEGIVERVTFESARLADRLQGA